MIVIVWETQYWPFCLDTLCFSFVQCVSAFALNFVNMFLFTVRFVLKQFCLFMNLVCSFNFVDVNVLVYSVRRPCTAGIVSFKKKDSESTLGFTLSCASVPLFLAFVLIGQSYLHIT